MAYDTGSFDLADPAHERFIPPLANLAAEPDGCDPHARRGLIPASLRQLAAFLRPGGAIENFCDGLCDADAAAVETGPSGDFLLELPNGEPACEP